jgi:primary-amine oxidase
VKIILATCAFTLLLAASNANAATHPLEPLSADEHRVAYEIVRAHFAASPDLPHDNLSFPFIALHEPAKSYVRSWNGAANFPREATVQVMHAPSNRIWIATADLRSAKISKLESVPAGTQPAVTVSEFAVADELVRAYEPWAAAMRARGVDPDDVYVDVWAPGDQTLPSSVLAGLPHGSRTRLLRAIAFLRGGSVDDYDPEQPQNPYVRPIEGVVVTIDMNRHRVVHMTDTLVRPVSSESGNASSPRPPLKQLTVVQPNGGSFEVTGRLVRWQNWQFYVVLHPREGLVLYDVRYDDHGTMRQIAYRLSLSEIYVPYGTPDPNWSWRTAFDVGEYNLGIYAQTLEPGRDVPDNASFFDAVFGSDTGPAEDNPNGTVDLPQSIAMYERDAGLLWTRTDPTNAMRDTRARRELVVTWNAWIGNYIYGFDWTFGMDGTIDVKVVLTGTTLNRGAGDADEVGAPVVGVDDSGVRVSAPNHQHFFNFRLDMDVDGVENEAVETEVRHVPTLNSQNAFAAVETELTAEGFRDADPFKARHWEVVSAQRHRGYAIESDAIAVPYSAPDYEPLLRAAFASHSFWVTRFRDDERYAAGDFPNQGAAGAGLPAFTSPPEPLNGGNDLVVWHTIGLTHVPRPEDYPVMPSESIGFKLVPHGFFDRNPSLDAPDRTALGRRRAARH